jgi:hypothetical protein
MGVRKAGVGAWGDCEDMSHLYSKPTLKDTSRRAVVSGPTGKVTLIFKDADP